MTTTNRLIAADALFVVLYIGFAAAMAAVTFLLVALLLITVEPGMPLGAVALANGLGWLMLPLAPRVYRWIVGQPFRWRDSQVFGGQLET